MEAGNVAWMQKGYSWIAISCIGIVTEVNEDVQVEEPVSVAYSFPSDPAVTPVEPKIHPFFGSRIRRGRVNYYLDNFSILN